jgi:hypothetical protein
LDLAKRLIPFWIHRELRLERTLPVELEFMVLKRSDSGFHKGEQFLFARLILGSLLNLQLLKYLQYQALFLQVMLRSANKTLLI